MLSVQLKKDNNIKVSFSWHSPSDMEPITNATSSMVPANATNVVGFQKDQGGVWREPHILQQLIMWVITVPIVVLNLMVFCVVPRVSSLQNSTGAGMISLAIADTSVGITTVINLITSHISGTFFRKTSSPMCHLLAFFGPTSCLASILTLTFLNVDRFLTLTYPLRYPIMVTTRHAYIILGFLWILSVGFMLPPTAQLGVLNIKFYNGMMLCIPDYSLVMTYTICLFSVGFTIPTLIIMVSAFQIFKLARHQVRRTTDAHNTNQNTLSKKDRQIIKTMLIMTLGYYLMWSPYFMFGMLWDLSFGHTINLIVDFTVIYLAMGNSMVNPLIYIPTIRNFRTKLISLLHLDKHLGMFQNDSSTTGGSLQEHVV